MEATTTPPTEFYSLEALDHEINQAKALADDPSTEAAARFAAQDRAFNLRLKRDTVQKNLEKALGPEITVEQVGQHLAMLHERTRDFQQDQFRIRQAAKMLAEHPEFQGDPIHGPKVDTTPRHAKPELTLGVELKSPVQRQQFVHALGAIAEDVRHGAEVQALARDLLANRRGELEAEFQRLGVSGDPVIWLHEKKFPRDRWPEPGSKDEPNMARWGERVLRGEVSADAIPFLDVALERGELCFDDFLEWSGADPRVAEKVRPKLRMLLDAAEARGLIRSHVGDGTKRRPDSGYWLAKTGRELGLPMSLRGERGEIMG